MLYLAIDQHAKQLTISLRNEDGQVLQRRQVSTEPARVDPFLKEVRDLSQPAGGFLAILEVCGFNDWLIQRLREHGCRDVILIHPDHRSRRKTDRRDAHALGEILWLNRDHLKNGRKPAGLRRVTIPTGPERDDRQLTALRHRAGRERTRVINGLKHLLLKHNLLRDCPTQGFDTKAARKWLWELSLGEIDQLELQHLLERWNLLDVHIAALDQKIELRSQSNEAVRILRTCPGISHYSGLALASRIGSISRFPQPRSLANYWGLTPRCRNSGETSDRLGSITKDGSKLARFILGQLVLHVLKRDGRLKRWFQGIKRRRGSKIARVAVMRRLTTIFWHMLTHKTAYQLIPVSATRRPDKTHEPNTTHDPGTTPEPDTTPEPNKTRGPGKTRTKSPARA